MAKLEEIERQLYQKEKEAQEKLEERARWRVFFPRTRSKVPSIWVTEHPPTGPRESAWVRHPWRYFFGGVTLLLIILSGVFVFLYLRSQGQEAQIEIQSDDTTASGSIITIPIVYKNISHVTLHDGQIAIILPPGAFVHDQGLDTQAPPRVTRPVEDLKPGDQGVIQIEVRLFGHENEDQTIEAVYSYRPENVNAQFSSRGKKIVRIIKVPLSISWDIPQILSRGQDVPINVHYLLDNSLPFQNIALKMDYPAGFTFASADPKPAVGETIWQIGTLQSGQGGVITVHGIINGEEGEIKAFHASLGTFDPTTKEWRNFSDSSKEVTIAVTPLSVQGFLGTAREGVIQPGEQLEFTLHYRNNTTSTLKNVTVKALLEGNVLDRASVKPKQDGVVDSQTGAIVWGPGNVADLKQIMPDETGDLAFTITVKDPPPVASGKDKNLTIVLHSLISAATTPEELKGTNLNTEDIITFNVASKVIFSGKALHGASPLANSGAFPPHVGEKTTYAISWELRNFTNDLANAQITATLPPNVKWEGVTRTDATSITYDEASSQVRWDIGSVPAGTGVLTPTLTGAFQISITPAEVDAGKTMKLISESQLNAMDVFTNTPVNQTINAMDTELRLDPTAHFGDGVVR